MPFLPRLQRIAPALLAVVFALLAGAPAFAASCKGASHEITLSNGRANPGNGTPATDITFKVLYADSGGCKPTQVSVLISGVGTLRLSGSGSHYASGVVFARTMNLPVGKHSYSFTATSGSGAGEKTATLTAVSPSVVTIKAPAPAPTPTPQPTAAPQPTAPPLEPSPTPRPSATAKPTHRATPSTTPSASPTPAGSSAKPSMPPSPQPPAGGLGHSPSASPTVAGASSSPSSPLSLPVLTPVMTYLLTTGGGLGLFMLLMRRRPTPVMAGLLPSAADPEETEPANPAPTPRKSAPLPGEAALPRWLRPSVQRARGGDGNERRRSWD